MASDAFRQIAVIMLRERTMFLDVGDGLVCAALGGAKFQTAAKRAKPATFRSSSSVSRSNDRRMIPVIPFSLRSMEFCRERTVLS